MAKNACDRTMYNMDRVFDAIAEIREQHSSGLINSGECVRICISKFEEFAHYQLCDAKRTVEGYGHTPKSFRDFMNKEIEAENKKLEADE